MKLYGICREIGYCVDTCQLCADIGRPERRVRRGKVANPIFDIPELQADEIEQTITAMDLPKRRKSKPMTDRVVMRHRTVCGWCSKTHAKGKCEVKLEEFKAKTPAERKADLAELELDNPTTLMCGCMEHAGKKIKYCNAHFETEVVSIPVLDIPLV